MERFHTVDAESLLKRIKTIAEVLCFVLAREENESNSSRISPWRTAFLCAEKFTNDVIEGLLPSKSWPKMLLECKNWRISWIYLFSNFAIQVF